ncbi:MAG: hypothetical protein JJ960_12575 [Kordiimonadaceae bacterium]|nr:hypothetical protein [Kordiimonadaceae bacterium]MBO6569581.1 hypothetical protein [Kordiimonadaceae bacterium]
MSKARQFNRLAGLIIACSVLASCAGYRSAKDVSAELNDSAKDVAKKVDDLQTRDASLVQAITTYQTNYKAAREAAFDAKKAAALGEIDRIEQQFEARANELMVEGLRTFIVQQNTIALELRTEGPLALLGLKSFRDQALGRFTALKSTSDAKPDDLELAKQAAEAAAVHRTSVAVYYDLTTKMYQSYVERANEVYTTYAQQLEEARSKAVTDFGDLVEQERTKLNETEFTYTDPAAPPSTEAYAALKKWVEAAGASGEELNKFLNSPILIFRALISGTTEGFKDALNLSKAEAAAAASSEAKQELETQLDNTINAFGSVSLLKGEQKAAEEILKNGRDQVTRAANDRLKKLIDDGAKSVVDQVKNQFGWLSQTNDVASASN